jgi:acetylornithine deacetylase/succinyl-diaminopimelate desuccinylase-like protein
MNRNSRSSATRSWNENAPKAGICHPVRRTSFVSALREFVRFPSISTQPTHAADVRRCARWLAGHLRRVGLEHVRVIKTARHPLVYADWLRARGRPTVLVYGHYDVQPADPLPSWTTPPFGAVIRGSALYGRGACDDKGQMLAHVKAIECLLAENRELPVNIKCLFEGEEEIGSPNLFPFLARNRRALAADVAVISDTAAAGPERPAITYTLRGGLGIELSVRGLAHDLHSGHFGGAVHNPLQALCEIIAGLHDRDGRIAIAGFYDRVRTLPADERAFMARDAPSDAAILTRAGASRGWGEPGYTLHERTAIRPALTVNGLTGGYQGPGGKAVIPAVASAKLSFRLVSDQDPAEIEALFHRHIARVAPPSVHCTVRRGLAARPAQVDLQHPAVRAAASACASVFRARPAYLRTGGTIPVVSALQDQLHVPTVLLGFAPPGANIHAPNENFPLTTFFKAIETCARFLVELGGLEPLTAGATFSRESFRSSR